MPQPLSKFRFNIKIAFAPKLLCVKTILSVELIDTSTSGQCLLLAGVEGMALRADFYVDFGLCGANYECVTTVAGNSCLIVCGLDVLFHCFYLTICCD